MRVDSYTGVMYERKEFGVKMVGYLVRLLLVVLHHHSRMLTDSVYLRWGSFSISWPHVINIWLRPSIRNFYKFLYTQSITRYKYYHSAIGSIASLSASLSCRKHISHVSSLSELNRWYAGFRGWIESFLPNSTCHANYHPLYEIIQILSRSTE